jgi:hypothetical protein
MYRVVQEERSIFLEVIVSVILSKKLYMCMCPIPNGFRVRAIPLYSSTVVREDALRRATCHVLSRVTKCIDADGGIFEKYYPK